MKRFILAFAAALTIGAASFPQATAQIVERPNVLVILTDDQRASLDTYEVTPRLMNRVRDNGTWFKNAVTTHPLCCPSRVSIFSGLYSHNHGTRFNGGKSFTPEEQKRTVQYQLRQAGYKTAVTGKFLNGWGTANPPYFDRWAIFTKLGYYSSEFNVNGTIKSVTEYSTMYLRDRAIEFLNSFEQTDSAPWLMYVHPWAPHKPYTPEKQYESTTVPGWQDNPARSEEDRSDKPAYVQNKSSSKSTVMSTRAKQLRTLMSVDDMAAAIFDKLDALGETNTIVFFLSDNGFQWYEHKLFLKRYPYNDSVRIPMFVSWPGHLEVDLPGTVRENIVGNIDVAPTIYELTGVVPTYVVDGKPMFSSERDRILIEYWHESHEGSPPTWKALWNPSWTYVEYPEIKVKEYYAPDDPWQLENVFGNNISGDEPGNQALLSSQLANDSSCTGVGCP